jgi:hypothetical protein
MMGASVEVEPAWLGAVFHRRAGLGAQPRATQQASDKTSAGSLCLLLHTTPPRDPDVSHLGGALSIDFVDRRNCNGKMSE